MSASKVGLLRVLGLRCGPRLTGRIDPRIDWSSIDGARMKDNQAGNGASTDEQHEQLTVARPNKRKHLPASHIWHSFGRTSCAS